MTRTITLNDEEWELVIDLLESERKELPGEIHHTDSPDYKSGLLQRLDLVNRLLTTLRSTQEVNP